VDLQADKTTFLFSIIARESGESGNKNKKTPDVLIVHKDYLYKFMDQMQGEKVFGYLP